MKPKNALIKINPLLSAPSFTSKDAAQYGVSSALLNYYVKLGTLYRIGHGIYRGVNAPIMNDLRFEDLIEVIQRISHGVICLVTALSLYNLTDDMPSQHWIAVKHGSRHRVDSPLIKIVRMRNILLGKTTITLENFTIPIFDRERTILDAFRYLGRETALKALKIALSQKGAEKLDIEKMIRYSKKLRIKIEPFLLAMTL